MKQEIARLKGTSEESLKLVVLLTQKASRKKTKIAGLKRQIEMIAGRLKKCTLVLAEMKREMADFREKSVKNMMVLRDEMKMLAEKLKSWEDVKLLFINPKEMQDLIKQREFFKGTIFPVGNEYLAENICKLQTILKEKTGLLLSLESGKPDSDESKEEELQCPYKKHVEQLESQADELKGRIDVLEKKEKLLNKMFTSNVLLLATR
eukprot:TRINITY_DN1725_c0_g1_i15.p1 TRINITY_DN1725_c0_g1~~TRINITY_DN1725_c0_g1_i15.p1  ORF type:complete len:207 (-),score=66.01 TRINITY_DN1725_c0_g1_i15:259-879(-)